MDVQLLIKPVYSTRWLPQQGDVFLMREQNDTTSGGEHSPAWPRRRHVLQLFAAGLLSPLAACDQARGKTRSGIVLDVEMYSYVDRVLTDIVFNGTALGVMNKYGGTGTIVGVSIPFGEQSLRWTLDGPERTPRNGETVRIKNTLVITPSQIPAGAQYLGLHLYPDDTAEITFADEIPERTARGKKILSERA